MAKKEKKQAPPIWVPQAKQEEALVRNEFEILYGGARGGGKTDAGQAWLLYEIQHKLFRGLVIRQNAKDLTDWVDRAKRMYINTGAVFKGSPTEIHFPSGAIIRTGHLKDDNAYTQYQGHEYQKMLIEELTQIPSEKLYQQLISSCRSTVLEIRPQVFATTNPGGLGHEWVKKRWGLQQNPNETVVTLTDFGNRVYIPARVYDNAKLVELDPFYVKQLENISDPSLRDAWLNGSWSDPVIEGQVYRAEILDAKTKGRITNVDHDPRYPVYTWWDLGTSDATAIGFFQFIGGSWRLIDYHSESAKGLDWFNQILKSKGYFYGAHYAPHDVKQRERSTAVSTLDIAANLGLYFEIVPKISIENGINSVRLKFPILWIDEHRCQPFVDAIRNYRYEEHDKGSIMLEENGEMKPFKPMPIHDWSSHAADMLRYWAVTPDPIQPGTMQEDWSLYNTDFK